MGTGAKLHAVICVEAFGRPKSWGLLNCWKSRTHVSYETSLGAPMVRQQPSELPPILGVPAKEAKLQNIRTRSVGGELGATQTN